jgi:hypothetical protein
MTDGSTEHTVMREFAPGIDVVAEVTTDRRFTGGRLVHTYRSELLSWLECHGIGIRLPLPVACAAQAGPESKVGQRYGRGMAGASGTIGIGVPALPP